MSHPSRLDNRLALGQVIDRLDRCRIGWHLHHRPEMHVPEYRYELRIVDGPVRAIFRGSTATMAATAAQDALDAAKVGWDE